MSEQTPNPFGALVKLASARPEWLRSLLILGGAFLSFALALLLLISLYRNRIASYEPTSEDAPAPVVAEKTESADAVSQPGGASAPPSLIPSGEPWAGKQIDPRASAANGPLSLEVEGLTPLRFPGQRPIFFKAIVRNRGSAPIGFAKIEVRLFDHTGQVLEKNTGYAALHTLFPGETSGVTILFNDPDQDYSRAAAHIQKLAAPYGTPRPIRIKVTDGKVAPHSAYSFRATGSVTNMEDFPLTAVRVFAIVHGEGERLAGEGSGYIRKKVLAPGEQESFSFDIMPTYGTPGRTEFYAGGREAK